MHIMDVAVGNLCIGAPISEGIVKGREVLKEEINALERIQLKIGNEIPFNRWLYKYIFETLDKTHIVGESERTGP